MEQTVETLAVRVDKLEKDTTELFERVTSMTIAQAAVSEKLNSMLVTLGEVKQAVNNLLGAPAKHLEWLVRALLAAVLSGVCGYFLAKIR